MLHFINCMLTSRNKIICIHKILTLMDLSEQMLIFIYKCVIFRLLIQHFVILAWNIQWTQHSSNVCPLCLCSYVCTIWSECYPLPIKARKVLFYTYIVSREKWNNFGKLFTKWFRTKLVQQHVAVTDLQMCWVEWQRMCLVQAFVGKLLLCPQ